MFAVRTWGRRWQGKGGGTGARSAFGVGGLVGVGIGLWVEDAAAAEKQRHGRHAQLHVQEVRDWQSHAAVVVIQGQLVVVVVV